MKLFSFVFSLALASGLFAAPLQPGGSMKFNDPDGAFALSPTYADFGWSGSGASDASRIASQALSLDTGSDTLTAPLAGVDLSTLAVGQSLTLNMTFTLPAEDPQIAEFVLAGARFGMAPNAAGTLLLTDLNAKNQPVLAATPIQIQAGASYPVTILSTWSPVSGIRFTVTVGSAAPVAVRSILVDAEASALAAVSFAGQAAVDNLALPGGSVPLPDWLAAAIAGATPEETAAIGDRYTAWFNDEAGGDPDPNGADAGAFLFNLPVGSDPALRITSIRVSDTAVTVTVRGLSAGNTVSLAAINGVLAMYTADRLTGTFTPYEALNFTTDAQGVATVNIPIALGHFTKAAILYLPPAASFDSSAL